MKDAYLRQLAVLGRASVYNLAAAYHAGGLSCIRLYAFSSSVFEWYFPGKFPFEVPGQFLVWKCPGIFPCRSVPAILPTQMHGKSSTENFKQINLNPFVV